MVKEAKLINFSKGRGQIVKLMNKNHQEMQRLKQQQKKTLFNLLFWCSNLDREVKKKDIRLTTMKYYFVVLNFWRGIQDYGHRYGNIHLIREMMYEDLTCSLY
jgi:hypothetical protein